MKLVAGLGNPGLEYRGTRHNAGFDAIDALSARHGSGGRTAKSRFQGLLEEIRIGDWIVQRTCPHRDADLAVFGEIDGDELVCTLHGWRFECRTGRCLNAEERTLRIRHAD